MLQCPLCSTTHPTSLHAHVQDEHGRDPLSVMREFGVLLIHPDRLRKVVKTPKRTHPTTPKVFFGDLDLEVNTNVPASACLRSPPNYIFPKFGELALDINQALICVVEGHTTWIWGPQGTGKDSFISHFCAATRTPSIMLNMVPGMDIEHWFYTRSFNSEGTFWEEGEILKAIRDGYVCSDGEVIPYTIVFTDIDRTTKEQAEYLRLILDTNDPRVVGPKGKVYDVLKGTRFVATANSTGFGDEDGFNASANFLDGSFRDRWLRVVRFHAMEWEDEGPICMKKFPKLPVEIFKVMGKVVGTIRKNKEEGKFYGHFSHRAVCGVLGNMQDLMKYTPKDLHITVEAIFKKSFRVWTDGLPDEETRKAAYQLMEPFISGGSGSRKRVVLREA